MVCFVGNLRAAHFQQLVLCDLSMKRAHEYFLSLIKSVPEDIQTLLGKDIESFKTVFHITGGRMYFIERYVNQVKYARKSFKVSLVIILIDFGS